MFFWIFGLWETSVSSNSIRSPSSHLNKASVIFQFNRALAVLLFPVQNSVFWNKCGYTNIMENCALGAVFVAVRYARHPYWFCWCVTLFCFALNDTERITHSDGIFTSRDKCDQSWAFVEMHVCNSINTFLSWDLAIVEKDTSQLIECLFCI